jgi:pyruvate kinase
MDVARLNFSHGTHEQHAEVVANIRALAEDIGRPITIMQDLSGPKVRVGQIEGNGVTLVPGDEFILASEPMVGNQHMASVSIPEIVESVPAGAHLLLDDGLIDLLVVRRKGDTLVTKVVIGGVLSSHKGVNAPGHSLPIASITDKDLEDLKFGIEQKVDWIAASFIRNSADMAVLRGVCNAARARIPLIAKIEKHEAVKNIDDILSVVDGVMVARGDLGVEIPIDHVPIVQKMIIKKANAAGKPVITATQMLDSMIRNPRPTRAEVSDVANAIYDGTDAIMLSGETAVGQYPFYAVSMMDQIACCTEGSLSYRHIAPEPKDKLSPQEVGDQEAMTRSIAQATCDVAQDLGATAIIAATSSGTTALAISRYRPSVPIIAPTTSRRTYSRLGLVWGVAPVMTGEVATSDEMMQACIEATLRIGAAKDGDIVVVTGGVPVNIPGSTNFLKVHRIGQPLFSA